MSIRALIASLQERLDDPEVFAWAMERAREERALELGPERAPATALFDGPTVLFCLTVHAGPPGADLIEALAPAALREALPGFLRSWPQDDPDEVAAVTRVIAALDPDAAVELFASALSAGRLAHHPDALYAVGVALCELGPARGAAASATWIARSRKVRGFVETEVGAALAVIHGLAEAPHLVARVLGRDRGGGPTELYRLLSRNELLNVVHGGLQKHSADLFGSMAGAFRTGAPLGEIDRLIGTGGPFHGHQLAQVLSARDVPLEDAARAVPYLAVLAGIGSSLSDEGGAFVLAACLDGYLLRERDVAGMPPAEAVRCLKDNPFFVPEGPRLIERLEHQELAPHLVELLSVELADERGERAMDALVRLGDPVVPLLIRIAEDPAAHEESTRGRAAEALSLIATDAAVNALVGLLEREGAGAPGVTAWVPRVPDPRILTILARLDEAEAIGELTDAYVAVGTVLGAPPVLHLPASPEDDEVADPPLRESPPPAPVLVNQTGRNDPCPCGSGKKYKKCCLSSPA